MPLRLSDVLAEPTLGLQLVNGPPGGLARSIRWVAVTELADPRPFLSGGELVLTTGLRQRSAATQREFVCRIAERDAVGIGFGVGLTHKAVPAATLAEAGRLGLPVLSIPYSTPFIAVDQFVADRILEEQYGRFQDLLDEYDTLARSLLSGRGLGALIDSLHQILGAPVMVVDQQGHVLAASPAGVPWPVEAILSRAPSADLTAVAVQVEEVVAAHLCCWTPRRSADVLPYAVALVGLELARRQAVLAGQRQLVGQVLADVIRGGITATEGERRLATFGIQAAEEHAVLVGTVDATGGELPVRLTGIPQLPGATTAVLDECLVAVVNSGQDSRTTAQLLLDHLGRQGAAARVGVGGWRNGVAGLRWSYYEACEAMSRGPGVNDRERMSLSGLLLASEDVPLRDLAEDLLRPLREFDAGHGGALLQTLREYLDANGSVATVAERLIVHRNTVRYRLEQIEGLTGRSLGSTADRVQLWLALAATQLGEPPRQGGSAASG